MYRYVRKLAPKTLPTALATGIFFHKCAAAGYSHMRRTQRPDVWLQAALGASYEADPVDRDGILLGLAPEQVDATRDMLQYFWENTGRYDEFREILIIDEEEFFEFAGWKLRITIDLAAIMHDSRFVLFDHKTSSDISDDMAFLPLDLQTHLYYYGANKILARRPDEFVHNFVRRFDFASAQMTGPPSFARIDGTRPYYLTKSGKPATRSDDPNEYLRRVRTPLTDNQLRAYEEELTAQLNILRYHQLSGNYPRRAQKGYMGCSNCAYHAPCSHEMDGHESNPAAMAQAFIVLP